MRKIPILLLAVLLGPGTAHSLSTDADQPIEIEADFAELDEQEGRTVYSGNVVVVQGSIRMTGARLLVNFDDAQQLEEVYMSGSPATFRQRPDGADADITGEALKIEYFADSSLLHLIENARLTRGGQLFEGARINFDTERSVITARSSAASPAPEGQPAPSGGRVRIVIPPRRKTR